ncbi:MAG: amino-acid N-acetyltransferase [Treponema sp.]|jgi:amino-acid N-acetyltransferase|nr:amino-acid N-acetyltransferase [Treponema sp.]
MLHESAVDLIREAFHYQSRFEGSTMVFKIDFPVTEVSSFPYLMKDLALLAKIGFRVIIVPGAKERINAVLHKYDIVSRYAGNIRITTMSAIPFVEMAAFDAATRFMTGLSADRVDAVIGNFVRARGLGVIQGVDMENTGMVDKIYAKSLERVLTQGIIPILPCIGWSPVGKPYNVPSDEIALAVCTALNAIKLFVVSANAGVRPDAYQVSPHITLGENGRILRLTPQEAERIIERNAPHSAGDDPALRELQLALRAVKAGVDRAHVIDGREEGALLQELFSNLGAGTMIYADEHEAIRVLRHSDIPVILRLMEPLVQKGNLIRRSADQIQEKKADYVVFEVDGSIHACGALHAWGDQAEIAALATDPAYADMGLGRRIVKFLIDRARREAFSRVFVLTTRTHDWFEFLGFKEVSAESLPERKNYDRSRNSKVFALGLSQYGSDDEALQKLHGN